MASMCTFVLHCLAKLLNKLNVGVVLIQGLQQSSMDGSETRYDSSLAMGKTHRCAPQAQKATLQGLQAPIAPEPTTHCLVLICPLRHIMADSDSRGVKGEDLVG